MNSFQTGMGFSVGTGGNSPMAAAAPGFQGNIQTGGISAGINTEPGVLALILLTAGLTIIYLSTRKIQGSL